MSYFAIHHTAEIIGEADPFLSMTALWAAAGGGRRSPLLATGVLADALWRSLTKADRSPNSPPRDEWKDAISSSGVRQIRSIYTRMVGLHQCGKNHGNGDALEPWDPLFP
jgi:hypothetical protein